MTKPLPRAYAIHMAIVSLLSSYASQVLAGGTALSENNISGIGNAYAGAAVEANDPSVLFANPAALTRFKRAELVQGVIVPTVRAKYVSNAGDNTAEDGSASPAGRSYERDTPARVVAPFNYLAVPINDRTVFGASISGSHGLVVRYPQEYPGRTQSTDTDLKVIRINTGLGYKLTDKLSVGGNLSFETFFTDIKTHINYATAVGGVTGIPAPLINAATNLRESSANIRVFGNAFNAQVGAMFEPSERMRFGIGYRPKTKFKNKGYLHIEQDAAQKNFVNTLSTASPAQGAQLGENQTVDQDITLPDELNMSAFFNVSPKLDLMASYIRQNFTVTKLRFTRRADGSVSRMCHRISRWPKRLRWGLTTVLIVA